MSATNVFTSDRRKRYNGGEWDDDVVIDRRSYSSHRASPAYASPCAVRKPYCPPKIDCENPCNRNSWAWAGIAVFVILGIGLWVIKPCWVLAKGPDGRVIPDSQCIDWLALIIWDLIITFVLLFIAWIVKAITGQQGMWWY